ncbi:MAG: DUF2203 domain-containing protein [Candidatus Marinimicrobia bacterium]|nr:DUF2203 domain-containing protein [Candidatus Neomarinimicrobiota bacterium]MCH7954165.1 DUF2203 domain-containing protein [Candidatus Neomarinimicrobiota bacterium]
MKIPVKDKLFTVEEADKLLPEIRTILDEFKDRKKIFFELKEEVLELTEIVNSEEYRNEELSKKERILKATSNEIENLFEEIAKLGCTVKDIDNGLVDFISIFRGRKVFLCWKQGEDNVSWYHDMQTGFTGRKQIENPLEFKNNLV